jgi:hypothetical protein
VDFSRRIFAKDGILLEKLIKAVGILVHLAGNHPAALETTRYAIDFLSSFYSVQHYHLQHATALSIYLILASLPTHLIFPYFEHDIHDICQWLSHAIDTMPNETYRQTMQSLLLYLSELLNHPSTSLLFV